MTVATKSYTASKGHAVHAVADIGRNAGTAVSACGRMFATLWGDTIEAETSPRERVTCRTCIRTVGW